MNKKRRPMPVITQHDSSEPQETEPTTNPNSPIVADIQNLIQQQSELVGLIDNIQRITFKTRLTNKKLNSSISSSLSKVAEQTANGPYILEVEVFDTSGPGERKAKPKVDADGKLIAPDKIVFQFSVFESQAMNKVGEFGATYDASTIAPDLFAQAESPDTKKDKKKPDEAKTSSGQN